MVIHKHYSRDWQIYLYAMFIHFPNFNFPLINSVHSIFWTTDRWCFVSCIDKNITTILRLMWLPWWWEHVDPGVRTAASRQPRLPDQASVVPSRFLLCSALHGSQACCTSLKVNQYSCSFQGNLQPHTIHLLVCPVRVICSNHVLSLEELGLMMQEE